MSNRVEAVADVVQKMFPSKVDATFWAREILNAADAADEANDIERLNTSLKAKKLAIEALHMEFGDPEDDDLSEEWQMVYGVIGILQKATNNDG